MLTSHVKDVCKIGQGHDCCRYLVMGTKGFECAKLQLSLRHTIDGRVHKMSAQADNCEGKDQETLNKPE